MVTVFENKDKSLCLTMFENHTEKGVGYSHRLLRHRVAGKTQGTEKYAQSLLTYVKTLV